MYQIIQKRKIWLTLSGILVGLSVVSLFVWGLKFGIDFTGGSLLEVDFLDGRPSVSDVRQDIDSLGLGSLVLQPIGETGMILRFQDTNEEKHQAVLEKLRVLAGDEISEQEFKDSDQDLVISDQAAADNDDKQENSGELSANDTAGQSTTTTEIITVDNTESLMLETQNSKLDELRYDSVGPTIGQELKRKSITAMIVVLIAIVLYIAWAFRKVSKPVASWKYGLSAIVALFHDVIITMGVFAFLGAYYGVEINTSFVAAILTVLGYSVNDTIVVFDRIRENLPKSDDDFEGTVNTSVNNTIRRSINTSVTTLLVLVSIIIFGGSSIRDFVLALSIGVFIGTYSSIFLASPVLVVWEKLKKV